MLETLIGLGAGTLLLILFLWLLPAVLILRSDKTSGPEKLIWVLLLLFFSWFSWILYLVIAPVSPKQT
jgi:hypothetical protein